MTFRPIDFRDNKVEKTFAESEEQKMLLNFFRRKIKKKLFLS